MSVIVAVQNQVMAQIEAVLMRGDLSSLSEGQRLSYYKQVCDGLGLNIMTRPFDYITLNGKLVLYASKGCAEQLRSIRKVSIKIVSREVHEGVYVVTAQAKLPDGREDESTGAVPIENLKGEAKANAMLKCETKAKRRVTLSICGLNMLDETEVETIPQNNLKVTGQQPEEGDGFTPTQYKINFGQWRALTLEQVMRDHGPEQIASYINYLEKPEIVAKRKPEQVGAVAEFIERASDFLAAFEMEAAAAAQS